ncbi:hypothetical protein GCM10009558_042910 [Virgisporangium aurantiacum]
MLVDRGVLAGQPDDPPHLLRFGQHVDAVHRGPTGVGPQQRREDAHGRGLAGTVRAEQTEDGSLGHAQVDAVERTHRSVGLDECLGHDGINHATDPSAC